MSTSNPESKMAARVLGESSTALVEVPTVSPLDLAWAAISAKRGFIRGSPR